MIKVAFGSLPKESGTFTFYRNQRPALLNRDIDMVCVAVGADQAALWDDRFVDEGCIQLAAKESNVKQQSQVFVDWCTENKIDIVIGINSPPILSALPHLPESIRVVSRCANAFDHGYRVTMAGRDRLARIVALTPRLRDDLIADYGANPDIIQLIPNGIEPSRFEQAASESRGQQTPIRLGFLGRLEHNQKGVLHLPKIVERLDQLELDYQLLIAGRGKHENKLEQLLGPQIKAGRVQLLGAISPNEVPSFLGQIDIFLFTSHFEGCPNALLEAMMAGCIPVSWTIRGITDFVIEDKKTGFLIPMDDTSKFADTISAVAVNSASIDELSNRVSQEARIRFSNEKCAAEYASLFQAVMNEPPPVWHPHEWSQFKLDPAFPTSKLDWIPRPIKIWIKTCLQAINR